MNILHDAISRFPGGTNFNQLSNRAPQLVCTSAIFSSMAPRITKVLYLSVKCLRLLLRADSFAWTRHLNLESCNREDFETFIEAQLLPRLISPGEISLWFCSLPRDIVTRVLNHYRPDSIESIQISNCFRGDEAVQVAADLLRYPHKEAVRRNACYNISQLVNPSRRALLLQVIAPRLVEILNQPVTSFETWGGGLHGLYSIANHIEVPSDVATEWLDILFRLFGETKPLPHPTMLWEGSWLLFKLIDFRQDSSTAVAVVQHPVVDEACQLFLSFISNPEECVFFDAARVNFVENVCRVITVVLDDAFRIPESVKAVFWKRLEANLKPTKNLLSLIHGCLCKWHDYELWQRIAAHSRMTARDLDCESDLNLEGFNRVARAMLWRVAHALPAYDGDETATSTFESLSALSVQVAPEVNGEFYFGRGLEAELCRTSFSIAALGTVDQSKCIFACFDDVEQNQRLVLSNDPASASASSALPSLRTCLDNPVLFLKMQSSAIFWHSFGEDNIFEWQMNVKPPKFAAGVALRLVVFSLDGGGADEAGVADGRQQATLLATAVFRAEDSADDRASVTLLQRPPEVAATQQQQQPAVSAAQDFFSFRELRPVKSELEEEEEEEEEE